MIERCIACGVKVHLKPCNRCSDKPIYCSDCGPMHFDIVHKDEK